MKKKLKVFLGLTHLALPLALFGCSTSSNTDSDQSTSSSDTSSSSSEVQEEDDDEDSGQAIQTDDDSDEDENKLVGTCPKGRHCSAPGHCSLFVDSNDNDLCDRGE